MSNHTPTPWALREGWAGGYEIYPLMDGPPEFGDWAEVATVPDIRGDDSTEVAANAALIVRAVNSHDALVKALEDIQRRSSPVVDPDETDADLKRDLRHIHAAATRALALSKAEG